MVVKEESSAQSQSSTSENLSTSSLESSDIYEKGENIAKDLMRDKIMRDKKRDELIRRQGFMKRSTLGKQI